MKFQLPSITGPWKYVVMGLVALALVAAIVLGIKGCKEIDQQNKNVLINSGITAERSAGQGKVINDVQEARNAVANPSGNDLNRVCEKYNRNC